MNHYPSHLSAPVSTERKIPRPPNAFMLYRCDVLKEMKVKREAEGVEKNPAMVEASPMIGDTWRAATPEVRKKYYRLAEEAKKEHLRKYPHYKYKPAKRKTKEAKKGRKGDIEQTDEYASASTAGLLAHNSVHKGGKGFMDAFLDKYSPGSSSQWTDCTPTPSPSAYSDYTYTSPPTPRIPEEDMPIYMSTETDMQPELVINEPQPEIAPYYDFNPQWDEDLVKQRIVKIHGNTDQMMAIVPPIPSVPGQIFDSATRIFASNWNNSIDLRLLGYSELEIMGYGVAGLLSQSMYVPTTAGRV